jgi:phosphatidylglycerol lysyltransferase
LGVGASVAVLCAAFWILHREISHLQPQEILAQIRSIPPGNLLAALAFTACGYTVLTGYDALAMRYIGRSLSYRHTAQTAFMAFAVAHNVGIAALSGGSVRYRMYSLLGLSGTEIARVILFCSVTFGLGACLLLGLAVLVMPSIDAGVLRLSAAELDAAGVLLMALPVAYLTMAWFRSAPFHVGAWSLALPPPRIGLAQVSLSTADLALAAASLYILLPTELQTGFLPFLGIYLIAIAAGLVSNVPGGIGVFEAVLIISLPDADRSELLGAVILYRVIYYILPLFLALLLLAGHEVRRYRVILAPTVRKAAHWLSAPAPQLLGLAVFLAGVVLLVSGSTPAVESRLDLVADAIPLPLLELSHLAGSVIGVALLILAGGLFRRLRSAYLGAAALLAGGISASLIKGLDFEEALVLSVVLAFLWLSRHEFYRRGRLVFQPIPAGWVASIIVVLGFAWWIGMLSFRRVPYSNELWWQFAFHSDAPRMLRAALVSGLAAASFALWKLLRPGRAAPPAAAEADEMARVRIVLQQAGQASANAALTGDKRFLWSADRQSFIMYRPSRSHWIALGDPVGPQSQKEALAWSFRELADRADVRAVFYQVSGDSLPLYVDMGMALAKLGEEAWVPLADFSLEGSKFAEFRRAVNKARKEGAEFEIVPREHVGSIAGELREVSNDWLAEKSASEKGFSLGAFSEQYLSNFDCAVVRMEGRVTAFANLWTAPAAGELSVDLMRHNHFAPKGAMDYLFTELMLWGKGAGYVWFNLGMAPLSGLEGHELAPLWHKVGHLIFSHGESFYNFEGLRHYKEKFAPEWRPRYIAYPADLLGLPRALLETSRIISDPAGP